MNVPLSAVWPEITKLIEDGFSIIPVRDKPEGDKAAKSPYPYWKKYQTKVISKGELWEQMEKFGTTAVACIGGRISGNLETIDIDVKWYPGIDAKLFSAIKQLYPDIWDKLRLHRSPSGGFHIPYRIIDQNPPGNQKLARRATTPDDNTTQKSVAFIETRGEGGIILVPPSLGYSIYKAQPIPLLTWTERCSLISLCCSFNELVKTEITKSPTRKESEYYSLNPFDHFDGSHAGSEVLLEFGWKRNGSNSEFEWWNRPESKSKERHATYIKKKKVFWFWTTNTDFEQARCYSPSRVLADFKFDNDFKKTYKELVSRGFGKIRESKEESLVKRVKELPANASVEAKQKHEQISKERSEAHPYGVFWEVSPEGDRITVDREALYAVAKGLGLYSYKGSVYRLSNGFLRLIEEREFQDIIKDYINESDPVLRQNILNTYEHFLQVAGNFTMTRLQLLDESLIIRDTAFASYKFFSDCWIKITKTQVQKFLYSELPGYTFEDKYINRPFIVNPGGKYEDYLNKCVDFEKMRDHVLKVLGYLAHDYKDETTAYIIVMTEQCPDPRHGGGSGKNLFGNLLKNITTVATRPGEQIKYDEKFFQTWNGERIFIISDAPKDFKFLFLKEVTSGNAVLKKLWKNEQEISVNLLPKIIVNTNYSYEITDGGLKRRIIPLEFTDFFTRSGGVKRHYGGTKFPDDWSEDDWAGYNHIIISGIQEWLKTDLFLEAPALTYGGWRKQMEQTFGHGAMEFIYDNWNLWVDNGFITNTDFKKQLQDYFEDKGVNKIYWPSMSKVNKAIEEYGIRMGIEVQSDVQKKLSGNNMKCKLFIGGETPF